MTHTTTVTDTTHTGGGYGPSGHGTWRITCTCGWRVATAFGGGHVATAAAADHRDHASGRHNRPGGVYGCRECPL